MMTNTPPQTAGPYVRGALAALSVGAAAIHFAVMSEHFAEYWLFGAFFLVVAWAQAVWAVGVAWRPSAGLLWAGVVGNAVVLAVYAASRTTGLPLGPDAGTAESVGGADLVCAVFEAAVVVGGFALLRRSWEQRPVGAGRARALAVGGAVVVIAATSAVLTPALAGTDDHADGAEPMAMMHEVGSTEPPSAAQIAAADTLIKDVTAAIAKYRDIDAATAAGFRLPPGEPPGRAAAKNGQPYVQHFTNPTYQKAGLDPQRPTALMYAMNAPGGTPVLLGALFTEPAGVHGPQPGGSLTRWHLHDMAGMPGGGAPPQAANAEHLHVWTVPDYPGGPFADASDPGPDALRTLLDRLR